MDGPVELASSDFASLLGLSQQSGSRRLIELTEGGWIRREMGVRKQRIRITDDGKLMLQAEFDLYRRLFETVTDIEISGAVVTGLGEGRYYLSRPGYQQRFNSLLGWIPFPGTLNVELDSAEANKLRVLRRHPVHVIEGFNAEGRTFGGVTCYPAHIGEHACAAILPHRSHHSSTIEIIAPMHLREALPIHDGERITATIHLGTP